MERTVAYLNPQQKLPDAVADWLCGRVRDDAGGAKSLAHLMVVVPTAQSGRNLRLALAARAAAEGWGGILPPKIVMQNQVLQTREGPVAGEAEELATLADLLLRTDTAAFPTLFPRPPRAKTAEWAL